MSEKHWIKNAATCLEESLYPVPHESNEIDWKINLSENKERLTEHLIAFANHANGGFMVFGVSDSNGNLSAIAQDEAGKIINTLANIGRDAIEPPLILDHAIVEFKNTPILFVYITEQKNKPVHRRGKSIEESWIRSGGTTRKASRHDVGSLMLNSSAPTWEELRASSLISIDDIKVMLDIDTIAALLEKPLPNSNIDLAQWLVDEGVLQPDGRGFYVTNFGAIAAAKKLEQFPSLERKRIRVIRYNGTNKVHTIDELVGNKGYASGFEGLINHLKRILPHSEVIQQSLRQTVSVYPEIALRELIANALIHQDFTVTGAGPMIEIFEDRIEFTNPGTLLPGKRLDRLIGTTPVSRNEKLASNFRRYRICEERGTGFQKVVEAVELFGLPPILFTTLDNAFRVTLYAPRRFAEMSQQERIEACYQHAVLMFLSSQPMTNSTLRERLKLNEKQRNQVTNLIGEAMSAGRIKRKDIGAGNKFAEYLPYWA